MMFILHKNKPKKSYDDHYLKRPFVEAGIYPIVRFFDKDRVIVELNPNRNPLSNRHITLLRLKGGELINDNNQWGFDEGEINGAGTNAK